MAKHRTTPTVPEILEMIDLPHTLVRRGRKPPASVIRGVLAAKHDGPNHLLLRLAVDAEADDAKLATAWERAVQALLDTNLTYGWGSKPRRDRIRAVARDPQLLQAIQGLVANTKDVRIDLLAVLVADGSDASIDALVPHVDPAFVAQDRRLDRLQQLRTHATHTPKLDALFAEIGRAVDDRNARSPALALGPVIGVGKVEPLWFRVMLGSSELTGGNAPRVQGNVAVDSRRARWFSISITCISPPLDLKHTSFTASELHLDDLGLGRCEVAETPAWLGRAARKLRITWDDAPHVSSSLRGAKRDRVAAWLLGGG